MIHLKTSDVYAAFAILMILIGGCSQTDRTNRQNELSVVTVATATVSGDVVSRNPTEEELQSLRWSDAERRRIDAAHPRPQLPEPDASLHRVLAIGPDASIELDSGVRVRMDGVTCSVEGATYLSRLLVSDEVSVAIHQTRPAEAGRIPAEVWRVDKSSQDLPPAYSLIAETAVTSGWCAPDGTADRGTNDRFKALADMGAKWKARQQSE